MNKKLFLMSTVLWAVLTFLLPGQQVWAGAGVRCYILLSSADCASCYASSQALMDLPDDWATSLVFPASEKRQARTFVREVLNLDKWPSNRIVISDSLYRALGAVDRSMVVMYSAEQKRAIDKCLFKDFGNKIPDWRAKYSGLTEFGGNKSNPINKTTSEQVQLLPDSIVLSSRCTWVAQKPFNVVYDYLYNCAYIWSAKQKLVRIRGRDLPLEELVNFAFSPKQKAAREKYKKDLISTNGFYPRIEQVYLWDGQLWLMAVVREPVEQVENGHPGVLMMPHELLLRMDTNTPSTVTAMYKVRNKIAEYEPDLAELRKGPDGKLWVGVRKQEVGKENKVLAKAHLDNEYLIVDELEALDLPAFYVKTKGIGYISSVPIMQYPKLVFYFGNVLYDIKNKSNVVLPWAENSFDNSNGKLVFGFAVQSFGVNGDTVNFMLYEKGNNYIVSTNQRGVLIYKKLINLKGVKFATYFIYNQEKNAFEAITTDNVLLSIPV